MVHQRNPREVPLSLSLDSSKSIQARVKKFFSMFESRDLLCLSRFVRFVSTPEILERPATIESEILQICEAIDIQSNDNFYPNSVNKSFYLSKYTFLLIREIIALIYHQVEEDQSESGSAIVLYQVNNLIFNHFM